MASRLSLKTFLATARKALTAPVAQRATPFTFVVGNESADLDSLCSAVVMAYIRTNSPPHHLHIPLSNIPREDLALRTEMTALLRHAGLVPGDLLTLSDLPDLKAEETRWYLVDHNALTGPLKKFSKSVVGCIDHHVDEKVLPMDIVPRVVEPCGSCSSLIVDEHREAWDSFPAFEDAGELTVEDDRLAKLCMAPLLIDTLNLTEESKVRDKDVSTLTYLRTKVELEDFDYTCFFDEITEVKEDISELGFRDILRKDYKEWEESGLTLGISCAVQNFDYLLGREGRSGEFIDELAAWAREKKLDVASVMTTSQVNGEFQRHLLVWGISERGLSAVDAFPRFSGGLRLEQWGSGKWDDGAKRLAWRQRDITASRKQVAPLLRESLNAVGDSTHSQL